MMVGGFTQEGRELNENELEMVMQLKPHIEERVNRQFEIFTPIACKTQVVAGTNFLIKIQVDNDEYIHAKIFRPLPHTN
jgi:cystatin-A/B